MFLQVLPYDLDLLQQQLDDQPWWEGVPADVMHAVQTALSVVRMPAR